MKKLKELKKSFSSSGCQALFLINFFWPLALARWKIKQAAAAATNSNSCFTHPSTEFQIESFLRFLQRAFRNKSGSWSHKSQISSPQNSDVQPPAGSDAKVINRVTASSFWPEIEKGCGPLHKRVQKNICFCIASFEQRLSYPVS